MTKTLAEGLTEDYTLSREALDIENVNNTSDANKPVSTATQTALNLKADTTTVNTALALKADTTTVNTALALKADTTTVNTALALKADTSTVNTALALKADTSAMNTALALKQDISSLNTAIDSRITARVISYDEVHFIRDAGGVDGGTEAANNTAFNTALGLLSPTKGGKIIIPEGDFLLSNRLVDQPNVTIEGRGRGSCLKHTAANTSIIKVGSLATQGNRVVGFRARNFRIDGMGYDDTSNDYPMLFCQYVDDAIVENITCHDGGSFLRFGRGNLAWPLADQRSRYVRASNNYVSNMEFFNIELHGALDATVNENVIEGGAASNTIESLGIRIVKCDRANIVGNIVNATGRGIATSADDDGQQQDILVEGNTVTNVQYGLAFSAYGEIVGLTVTGNVFTGDTTIINEVVYFTCNDLTSFAYGIPRDYVFTNNFVQANSSGVTALVKFEGVTRAIINDNKLRNVGNSPSGTNYAIHLKTCDGLFDIKDNIIEMDASNSRGIWDETGVSTLYFNVHNNTMHMTNSTALGNAIAQSSSSGIYRNSDNKLSTILSFGNQGDSNFTLTAFTSPRIVYVTVNLTATRTVTLSTTNAYDGLEFIIFRKDGGGFGLNVGGLVTIAAGQWAKVKYHTSGGWILQEYYTPAAGAGATNLTTSLSSTTVTINSDSGTDATISAADGTNAGVMTSAMQVKLAGIATGATANSADATLLSRTNHTGSQAASTISDFSEAVDDRVGALVTNTTSVTWTYTDASGTLEANVSDEYIYDTVAAILVEGTNVTITKNDTNNTATIASTGGGGGYTDEQVDDRVNALLQDTTSITKAYDDTLNTLSLNVSDEYIYDTMAAVIVGNGTGVSLTEDDGSNTITFSTTAPTVQTFTANGTWTKPSNCRFIRVRAWGPGGSGGGVSGAASQTAAAGGGGSGSYSETWYNVTSITSATVVVGTGGAAPAAGANNGNNGSAATSFTPSPSGTALTAPAGSGGVAMTTGTSINASGGGSGGAAGTGPSPSLLAGGSGGGSSFRMSGTIAMSGFGGQSTLGGSGPGLIVQGAGVAGAAPGAGGSGAMTSSNTNRSGGAGANGLIIVLEYY